MDMLGGILGDVLGGLGGGSAAGGAGGAGGLGSLISGIEGLFGGGGGGMGADAFQSGGSQNQGGNSTLKDIASIAATVLPFFL